MSAAYIFPVTCAEVAYPVAAIKANPVIYDAAAGFPTGYTGTAFTVNRTTAPNPLTLTTINFIAFTLGTGGKYITNLGSVPLNPIGIPGCPVSIGPSLTCP